MRTQTGWLTNLSRSAVRCMYQMKKYLYQEIDKKPKVVPAAESGRNYRNNCLR
jgi:ssDNA-binding replication factor A large subunit